MTSLAPGRAKIRAILTTLLRGRQPGQGRRQVSFASQRVPDQLGLLAQLRDLLIALDRARAQHEELLLEVLRALLLVLLQRRRGERRQVSISGPEQQAVRGAMAAGRACSARTR